MHRTSYMRALSDVRHGDIWNPFRTLREYLCAVKNKSFGALPLFKECYRDCFLLQLKRQCNHKVC